MAPGSFEIASPSTKLLQTQFQGRLTSLRGEGPGESPLKSASQSTGIMIALAHSVNCFACQAILELQFFGCHPASEESNA
jgi:hypothetical protein